MTLNEIPFACDMTAIPADRRGEHQQLIATVMGAVEEVRELNDGYAFRLKGSPDMLVKAAQFIELERLCCPFFAFALQIEGRSADTWLSLTGRNGVKPFIMAEIGHYLPAEIQL